MKPLDKLEKEMFKAHNGFEYEDGVDVFSKEEIREMEDAARAAAKVAVDLAFKAYLSTMNFTGFLKSEGIETEK